MNYSHLYHAGNFADVIKHIVLLALIKSLLRKTNGFFYLDTHAGAGFYDLFSVEAKKNKEYESGILKCLNKKNPPELVKLYLACIKRINNRLSQSSIASLQYYPGSPLIAHYFLREQDRMILTEIHPQEYQLLKKHFSNDSLASIHLMDGYQGLKAFLPPKERRGLILIDPPFERPNEFTTILSMLPIALKRFSTGIMAIWYPIKDRPPIERFHRQLKKSIQQPILTIELSIYPENSPLHLNGCGMAVINSPWQFEEEMRSVLPFLKETLSLHQDGQCRIGMLK